MKSVKDWSTVICIAAVICTMVELVAPHGKMEKIIKFVLSTFLMCAMISPLAGTMSKISVDLKSSHHDQSQNLTLKDKVLKQKIDVASENVKLVAEKKLESINVKPKKIEVIMDTDGINSISMLKMNVYLNNMQLHQDIKKILEDELGIQTQIIYGSE